MPASKAELLDEAKRCAGVASKPATPQHQRMFAGLAKFYETLASLEPEPSSLSKNSQMSLGFDETQARRPIEDR